MVVIDNKVLAVRELPLTRDALPVVLDNVPAPVIGVDDVDVVTTTHSEEREMGFDFQSIDRRFTLVGVDSKAQVEQISLGEQFVPCRAGFRLNDAAPRPARKLGLQPALAGVVGVVIDKNYMSALAAVNQLYSRGGEDKLQPVSIANIKKLVAATPDPTRLLFRFAQMYAYYKFVEKTEVAFRPAFATNNPVHVTGIANISALLAAGAGGEQVLPFDLEAYGGDSASALTVLRYAAVGLPFPDVRGHDTPSVLTMNIMMPDVQVVICGSEMPAIVAPNISSSEVWDVMYAVAGQLGVVPVMDEQVAMVFSMMYSPEPLLDPVFRLPTVSFSLPRLVMGHYALFPVALACDSIAAVDMPDELRVHDLVSRMVLRSQLLSLAFREAMWNLGLGGTHRSPRYALDSVRWRNTLLTKGRKAYAPIWGVMLKYLQTAAVGVSVSRTMLTYTPTKLSVGAMSLESAMQSCSSWADVVDVLPEVPAAALDAVLHPKNSTKLLQPGVRYRMDNIAACSEPSVVHALSECGATYEMLFKKEFEINWSVATVRPLPGKYGLPSDRSFPTVNVDPKTKAVLVVTMPDVVSCVKLKHFSDLRRNWSWYLAGNGEKPHGDSLDDDEFPEPGGLAPAGPVVQWSAPVPDVVRDEPPTIASMTAAANEAAAVAIQSKVSVEVVPPAGNDQLPELSLRDRTIVDLVRRNAVPGLPQHIADTYTAMQQYSADATGRTMAEHVTPLASGLVSQLMEVNLVQSVAKGPRNERANTMAALGSMMSAMARVVDNNVVVKGLVLGAERARNITAALRTCSAITPAELAEDQQTWTSEVGDLIENLGDSAISAGIPLTAYTTPAAVGITSITVPRSEVAAREAEGYRRNNVQPQVEAAAGNVVMHKKKAATQNRVDVEMATMHIFQQVMEQEARVEEQIAMLSDPAPRLELPDPDVARLAAALAAGKSQSRVVELPAGMEQEAREREAAAARARATAQELEIARAEVVKQIGFYEEREKSYTDPGRKEYVHSKALALQTALDDGRTADELSELLIQQVGSAVADFGRAGAPKKVIFPGSLASPPPTGSVAQGAVQGTGEGVPSELTPDVQQLPDATGLDPDTLEHLEMF